MTQVDLLPDHWLRGYQAYAGLGLMKLSGRPSGHFRREVLSCVVQSYHLTSEHPTLGAGDAEQYLNALESLPAATLHSLCSFNSETLGEKWSHHIPYWQNALRRLKREGDVSPIFGAQLIADRILQRKLTASRLAQLARYELHADWTGTDCLQGHFGKLINILSNRTTSTHDRLHALAAFRRESLWHRWPLVENAILQQSFAWPSLILCEANQEVEFTLPVSIDVFLDGKSRDPFVTHENIDYTNWIQPLETALDAAKALWENKHKSWPDQFQEMIEKARVVVDLSVAGAIVRPYSERRTFKLTGRSAEAYLGLVILANFVDRAAIDTVCATGRLEKDNADPEGGADYNVMPMPLAYLKLKAEGARNGMLFHTFIAPNSNDKIPSRDHLRVCRGDKFSKFATHALGSLWRKHWYAMGADLACAFKPQQRGKRYDFFKHKCNQPKDHEVEWILRILERNYSNAVVKFDRAIKATSVARALYRINANSADRHFNGKQQVGSFAFIRVPVDDTMESFWQVVWEAIKGSDKSISTFLSSPPMESAKLLATELNKFQPTADNPYRAPDLPVIVQSNQDNNAESGGASGPFSRVQLDHFLNLVQYNLEPSPVAGIAAQVGATRIIFIPHDLSQNDGCVVRAEEINSILDSDLSSVVRRLSIYRFGFTFQMARRLLRINEEQCEAVLHKLGQTRYYGRTVLQFADGAGEYFLQLHVREFAVKVGMADLHFAAANSIVGFLDPDDDATRFNYREALNPVWLREARWHLNEAKHLAGSCHVAQRAYERLARVDELEGYNEPAKCA